MKPHVLLFRLLPAWLSLLLLAGCDMFRFHPYQELDGYHTGLTALNVSRLEPWGVGRDTLRFAFVSDPQRWYDDMRDGVNYINGHTDISFTLVGGDLTDFGATDEFRWMTDELLRLRAPWLAVIGNHDFLGLGEYNYQLVYGPYNFSLNVGHLHIVGLNTIWRDSERGVAAPDFDFIADDLLSVHALNALRPDSITHTVVVMHNMPGDEQFDGSKSHTFGQLLMQYPGLRPTDALFADGPLASTPRRGFCLKGHNHHFELSRPFPDGMLFYCVDDVHKRQLLLFTIYPDGYDYQSIYF